MPLAFPGTVPLGYTEGRNDGKTLALVPFVYGPGASVNALEVVAALDEA